MTIHYISCSCGEGKIIADYCLCSMKGCLVRCVSRITTFFNINVKKLLSTVYC